MDVFHKHAWYALVDRIGPRLAVATFDNFEIRNQEQKKLVAELRGYTEKIAENRAAGVNVILLGTCGVGKDHLSFCVAREAHKAGCSVAWTNGEELFADARDSMDGQSMSGFDFDDIIIGQPQSHAQPQPVAPAPVKTINPPTRPPADSEIWPQYAEPIKPPGRNGVHPAWAALLAFLAVTFFVLWLSTFRLAEN